MRRAVEQLVEFHRAVGQHVGEPENIDIQRDVDLRLRLIDEEFGELRDALAANSVVGVADALADLCYVVIGSAVAWGIPFAEVFNEVHRSNMTKVGGSIRGDGKILKPANYSRPDIAGVLLKQGAKWDVDAFLAHVQGVRK